MRYKCCDCGAVFDEEEAGTYTESRGEFWGSPCYETMLCCPECGCEEIYEHNGYDNEEDEEMEEDE